MADLYRLISAQRALEKNALVFEPEAISYGDLFARADRLAADLRDRVGSNQPIGLFYRKSIGAVVSMLAILASDNFFVPIDPEFPEDRVAYIASVCGLAWVIVDGECEQATIPGMPANAGVISYSWKSGSVSHGGAVPSARKVNAISSERLSYVLFTSGTTGRPKGVMIREESQLAFVAEMARQFGHDAQTKWLSVSPLYFDVMTLDFFVELYCGSTIFMVDPNLQVRDLPAYIERYEITHAVLISSQLKMLVSRYSGVEGRNISSLRQLWYGGEPCPVGALRKLRDLVTGVEIAQCYGPSEVCNNATLNRLGMLEDEERAYMPLGWPLTTVDAVVVDENMKQISEGTGELLLGGVQVMAGYAGDEEATRACMVDGALFGAQTRFYRTGDYVSVTNDGCLTFVGRRDHLVKLRGNRVSLHEVQAAILGIQDISDALVFVTKDSIAGTLDALNAIVLTERSDLTERSVKISLRQVLPKYMVPDRITLMSSSTAPVKENGKLDSEKLMTIVSADRIAMGKERAL